jgi:hypothetical protein
VDEEARVKRVALISIGLLAMLLAACAPSAVVATQVVPTIISLSITPGTNDVVLQGRYFGGGGEGSYVLVGADGDAKQGTQVETASWSPNRITFTAPEGTNASFVFVVVNGVTSNGMPANLR